jgi:aspartate/methionine/tyrosine aminotransferase
MDRKKLDFSKGDPLLPLTAVANYAFRESMKDLNQYMLPTTRAFGREISHILRDVTDYFTARGFKPDGWTGLPTDHVLLTGGGTTEAYDLIVRAMAEDVREWNGREGRDIKPAMLMPVPTYGFFLDNLRHHNIKPVPVARELSRNGALSPKAIIKAIRKAHDEGLRIVGFYDSNPNNPFGHVRGEAETRQLYRIIRALNELYRQEDAQWHEDNRSKKNKGYGWKHDGIASRARVIDDMVYDGLEYKNAGKPFAVGQIQDEEMRSAFGDSLTLFGPSKAGLANIRAGLIVGPSKLLDPMRELQRMGSYSPSKLALNALHAYFNDNKKFAGWRSKHLDAMNEQHRFNGLLMKALLAGLKNSGANDAERKAVTDATAQALCISREEAAQRLRRKIPLVTVLSEPQAGFFHLLDLTALKGRVYEKDCGRKATIENGYDLERLLGNANISMAYGSWMGMDNPFILRASFANSHADIIDFAARLRELVGETKPALGIRNAAAAAPR